MYNDLIVATLNKFLSEEEQTYSFLDYEITQSKTNYYRLKMTEYDGQISYSEIISIIRDEESQEQNQIGIYPNPTKQEVYFELSISKSCFAKVSLLDMSGKEVLAEIFNSKMEIGLHKKRLDISSLKAGIYTFRVLLDDRLIQKRLVVLGN